MASTKLSDTSRTAPAASRPLFCASDTALSTLDLARPQASLPLSERIAPTCSASRLKSPRSDCRSLSISLEAPAAALPISRTPSRVSLAVSRMLCETVEAEDMIIHRELEDSFVNHSEPKKVPFIRVRATNGHRLASPDKAEDPARGTLPGSSDALQHSSLLSGDRRGDRHGDGGVGWTCRGHHGPDVGVARRHQRRRCRPELRGLPRRSLVCRQ